jgi:hypothetical protein
MSALRVYRTTVIMNVVITGRSNQMKEYHKRCGGLTISIDSKI